MSAERASTNCVLFDLDGTLADTAPDLAAALNRTRQDHGRPALPLAAIRPHVSHGGAALIRFGFAIEPDHPEFDALRRELLDHYQAALCEQTTLFPGIAPLLDALDSCGVGWGVVTNKPARLTEPLIRALGLAARARCIVSGDTTSHSKPHPEPLLHAAATSGVPPERCLYVGDAERDIVAGRAAGMRTLVALFGYLGADDDPAAWAADGLVAQPHEILAWL